MKKILIFLFVVLLAIIAIVLLGNYKKAVAPTTTLSIAKKEISQSSKEPFYQISVARPVVQGMLNAKSQDETNTSINELLTNVIDKFKKEVTNNKIVFKFPNPSSLTIIYEVSRSDNKIISILFEVSDYQVGQAHPTNYTIPFNYNAISGKMISLSDIFQKNSDYLKILSSISSKDLKTQYQKEGNNYDIFIADGTLPKKENFQKFVLTKNALVLIFDPAQVGPYAAGVRKVIIPFSSISNDLNSQSI